MADTRPWGTTTANPSTEPTNGDRGGEVLVPNNARFDVFLVWPGCRGLEVIGGVCALTGESAAYSRNLVLGTRFGPKLVLEAIPAEDAERARHRLERLGATVRVVASDSS